MSTNSVYDPKRHSPESELRFANAALLNAAIAYVAKPNSRPLFIQLKLESEQVVKLREKEPIFRPAADDLERK